MTNYQFTTDWFSHNIPEWNKLADHLHQEFGNDLNCLEVGTWEGRSALYMLDNFVGSGQLTVIDQFHSPEAYRRYLANINLNLKKERVKTLTGLSIVEMSRLLSEKQEFHFIYIDAGKTAVDNLANLIIGERLLKVGGIMVVDDYGWNKDSDPKLCPKLGIDCFQQVSLLSNVFSKGYQMVFKKQRHTQDLILLNR